MHSPEHHLTSARCLHARFLCTSNTTTYSVAKPTIPLYVVILDIS
ncbi:MAG: hypothetical protein V1743_03185 [Nanoarchaeota archaeon]